MEANKRTNTGKNKSDNMRKIIFRGKRVKDCLWIYGELSSCINDIYRIETQEVLSFTIGQFIELQDMNDNNIFENDIVKVCNDLDESIHVVKWMIEDDYPAFDLEPWLEIDCNGLAHVMCTDATIEVVGNIHDNLELAEKLNSARKS